MNLPRHVAIIMDGNGRWANERGLPRIEGHRVGAKTVRSVVEWARRRCIRYLTLFSFSSENWRRSPEEIAALMELFEHALDAELQALLDNGIRLRAIGALSRLPDRVQKALERNMRETAEQTGMDLILAVSYGAREEILDAARTLADQVRSGSLALEDITEERFTNTLWTRGIPDPDLLIRTSGEARLSNFLLWQLAYTEIVILPQLWPELTESAFDAALAEYAVRERRFGGAVDRVAVREHA